MGLDMYAFRVKPDTVENPDALVDVKPVKGKPVAVDLAYWRKFNALHGWMEDLYRERNGADESFNCSTVRLTQDDLDRLEKALQENTLKPRDGFFFGSMAIHPEDVEATHAFIAKARQALAEGDIVLYDSWW